MKLGFFGGSFNPIHLGHLRAIDAFVGTLGLDSAVVIPSFLPPHKEMPSLWASFEDRFNMAVLALEDRDGVTVSDIEKRLYEESGEKNYTKKTLERLITTDDECYLLVGTDMFTTLHLWYEAEWIFDNVQIAVMARDSDRASVEEYKKRYEAEFSARVSVIDAPPIEISSTDIREGKGLDKLDDSVRDYIEKHHLYKAQMTYDELLTFVKGELSEKRFSHTLAVEREVRYFAEYLCPEFIEPLSRVALLHDITKEWLYDDNLEYARENKLPLTVEDMTARETVHARTGAIKAVELGESLGSIIDAHTTGKSDMSLFEKILFVADFTEETRKHESCMSERARVHQALDTATDRAQRVMALDSSVYRILESTVLHLFEKEAFIHPRTLEALVFYKATNSEEKNEKE